MSTLPKNIREAITEYALQARGAQMGLGTREQEMAARYALEAAILAYGEEARREAVKAKDGAYQERDRVVALAARMATILRWPTWLGQHEDRPGDPPWDADWRNIVFIELPSGQVSWHIHDSEVPLVRFLPSELSSVAQPWDGHDTAEKHRRCDAPWPLSSPSSPGAPRCQGGDVMARVECYGAFPGGDPREFHPDPECSTDAEREAHRRACALWDAGAQLGPETPAHEWRTNDSGQIVGHVARCKYGLGTYFVDDEEPRDA